MKTITIISKTWNSPYGDYTKYKLPDSVTYNAYKTFYFVSASGEAGVLDCFNQAHKGMEEIKKVFDKLFKEEYRFIDFRINDMRQDAWRYFADKSANNSVWFLTAMYGSPFKENATDEEMELPKFVEKKEITVESQEVTYKKWLDLSKEEQLKHTRLFLDSPVDGSNYIFNHTFHTNT